MTALAPLDPDTDEGRATAARLSEVFADVRRSIATRNARGQATTEVQRTA